VVITPLSTDTDEGGEKQSALAIPLSVRGQVIGNIRVHDTGVGHQWTLDEISLIEAIGDQMSLALENARLFGDTRQRAAREQLTREITDKMRASPDVNAIIETGLTELVQALGVSRTYVKLSPDLKHDEQPNGTENS